MVVLRIGFQEKQRNKGILSVWMRANVDYSKLLLCSDLRRSMSRTANRRYQSVRASGIDLMRTDSPF